MNEAREEPRRIKGLEGRGGSKLLKVSPSSFPLFSSSTPSLSLVPQVELFEPRAALSDGAKRFDLVEGQGQDLYIGQLSHNVNRFETVTRAVQVADLIKSVWGRSGVGEGCGEWEYGRGERERRERGRGEAAAGAVSRGRGGV
jgi:hypothetical protein